MFENDLKFVFSDDIADEIIFLSGKLANKNVFGHFFLGQKMVSMNDQKLLANYPVFITDGESVGGASEGDLIEFKNKNYKIYMIIPEQLGIIKIVFEDEIEGVIHGKIT